MMLMTKMTIDDDHHHDLDCDGFADDCTSLDFDLQSYSVLLAMQLTALELVPSQSCQITF